MAHREAIEHHLFGRAMDLLDLQPTVTLYDLSNTSFEGAARTLQGQAQRLPAAHPGAGARRQRLRAPLAGLRRQRARTPHARRDARCACGDGPAASPPRSGCGGCASRVTATGWSAASAPGPSTRKRRCASRPCRRTACICTRGCPTTHRGPVVLLLRGARRQRARHRRAHRPALRERHRQERRTRHRRARRGSMMTHPGVYCLRSSETDWDEAHPVAHRLHPDRPRSSVPLAETGARTTPDLSPQSPSVPTGICSSP